MMMIIINAGVKNSRMSKKKKKKVKHESDDYTNCNWYCWYSHQKIGKRSEGLGNNRTSRDHPNYCIIEVG